MIKIISFSSISNSAMRIFCLLAIALSGQPNQSFAKDQFPIDSRPIRIVSPFIAGGGTDSVARVLAPGLSAALGVPVIIDNRGGAGGVIGTDQVAKAPADGHTLLVTVASFVNGPSLYRNLPYDPIKDFTPIAMAARVPIAFAVRGDLPVNTLKEFLDLARANSKNFSLGNYGQNTGSNIYATMLMQQSKLDLVQPAYRGMPPLLADIVGGQVSGGFVDINTSLAMYRNGRIKYLAVVGQEEVKDLPGVPTLSSLGFKDFDSVGWIGFFVPAHTPEATVQKLARELKNQIQKPEFISAVKAMAYVPASISREEFVAEVAANSAKWARLIKSAGIAPN